MTAIVTLTMNPALDVATSAAAVVPDHKLRCSEPLFDPGGGGINVARAIVTLGGRALAVFLAGGATGAQIAAMLTHAGVAISVVPIAGTTRESLTVTDRATRAQYRFVVPGPTVSPAEQQHCRDQIANLRPAPDWFVLSGSLPPGVTADFHATIATLYRATTTKIVIDTSGAALAACHSVGAFLIKPSLGELAALVGHAIENDDAEVAAAQMLLDRHFADNVLVTLGASGALLVTPALIRRFPAPAVRIESAVGAGDAMLGAIILALSRGADLPAAVTAGIAAAASALTSLGTGIAEERPTPRQGMRTSSRRAIPSVRAPPRSAGEI